MYIYIYNMGQTDTGIPLAADPTNFIKLYVFMARSQLPKRVQECNMLHDQQANCQATLFHGDVITDSSW